MDQAKAVEERIERRLAEMLADSATAFRAAEHELSARGLFNSGAMIRRKLGLIKGCLVSATDWSFAEVERHSSQPRIAREVHATFLNRVLSRQLDQLTSVAKIVTDRTPVSAATVVDREVEALRSALAADQTEFHQGLWASRAAQGGEGGHHTTEYRVHVSGDVYGGIQQGGSGNVQTNSVSIDWDAARSTAEELTAALAAADLDLVSKSELQADVDAIRAQLRRASPNLGVVQELAKSARNVTEGVAGAAIFASAPHVVGLVHALAVAVGAAIGS